MVAVLTRMAKLSKKSGSGTLHARLLYLWVIGCVPDPLSFLKMRVVNSR